MKGCRNCVEGEATVGVFCPRCMKLMREDVKRQRQNEAYWRAVDAGAGDLWRVLTDVYQEVL